MPGGWHATREQLLWFHAYLDIPGWKGRYAAVEKSMLNDSRVPTQLRHGMFDTLLRDNQLMAATSGERQVWLVTQDYAGVTDTRRWLSDHGYHNLLSEIYFGDARLELWDRGTPASFGPAILRPGFDGLWATVGSVARQGKALTESGASRAVRTFDISGGRPYVANIEYRGLPGSAPHVAIQTFDRAGHVLGTITDRFGNVLDSFPRTEWYDMPVNGVWISQPFGFVAPQDAVRATFALTNQWGTCYWRNIAVYAER